MTPRLEPAHARAHPATTYLRIKAATRKLIGLVGGLSFAEEASRVRRSKLSDYGRPQLAEVFIAADVIADLEQAAGEPIVTRELAHAGGYELFRLPGRPDEDANFVALLGKSSEDTAAVISRLAKALGNDGKVTAREVRHFNLIDLADEAIARLVELRYAAVAAVDEEERRRTRG